jgi:hypothetical protein
MEADKKKMCVTRRGPSIVSILELFRQQQSNFYISISSTVQNLKSACLLTSCTQCQCDQKKHESDFLEAHGMFTLLQSVPSLFHPTDSDHREKLFVAQAITAFLTFCVTQNFVSQVEINPLLHSITRFANFYRVNVQEEFRNLMSSNWWRTIPTVIGVSCEHQKKESKHTHENVETKGSFQVTSVKKNGWVLAASDSDNRYFLLLPESLARQGMTDLQIRGIGLKREQKGCLAPYPIASQVCKVEPPNFFL